MNRPKISVIVPVYNTEKYLRRCLDSLINQTIGDIEVVAVDDGSPDNCGAILDEYKEKYPDKMQVIHKQNGGQASARNLAFKVCRGEYIGFLDSDDFVRKEMFARMYAAAKENAADYVACGYTDTTYEADKEVILKEYVASKPAHSARDMFFGALVSPFLHIYRKEVFDKAEVTFPEGYIYEDTAFYLNLIPHLKKIVTVEEPLAVRIRRSNSTMTTFKKEKVRNIFPVLKNSIDYYRANGFDKDYGSELEYFCVRILLCRSMERISRLAAYKDATELGRETLAFIKENFPDYRSNKYFLTGLSNLYMKSYNNITMRLYLVIFRIMNKFKKEYA